MYLQIFALPNKFIIIIWFREILYKKDGQKNINFSTYGFVYVYTEGFVKHYGL